MSTPTPAPALTDEQFDTASAAIRECFDDAGMHEVHDAWLAAVIDRAKREERERIVKAIATTGRRGGEGFNDGYVAGLRFAERIARQEPTP